MTTNPFTLEQAELQLQHLHGALLALSDVCTALIELGGQSAVDAVAMQHEETLIYTLNSPVSERVLDAHADMLDMVGIG